MSRGEDYSDREKYEQIEVPWSEVNFRKAELIAAGWFHRLDMNFMEEDCAVEFWVRPRSGYNPPKDRVLQCKDCHRSFTYTADEQRFFREKGLSEPKRCPDCRKKKRG